MSNASRMEYSSLKAEEWVYIDDLEHDSDGRFGSNGRLGQVCHNSKADFRFPDVYTVYLPGTQRMRKGKPEAARGIFLGMHVNVPWKNLCKVPCSVRAVRVCTVACEDSVVNVDRCGVPHYLSQVFVPAKLNQDASGAGDMFIMRQAGFPLSIVKAERRATEPEESQRPDMLWWTNAVEYQWAIHSHAVRRGTVVAPAIILRPDGGHLGVDDLMSAWEFMLHIVEDPWSAYAAPQLSQSALARMQHITQEQFLDFKAKFHTDATAFPKELQNYGNDVVSHEDMAGVADPNAVIQDVQHDEPPAQVDPYEAQVITGELWAQSVQRMLEDSLQIQNDEFIVASHAMSTGVQSSHDKWVMMDSDRLSHASWQVSGTPKPSNFGDTVHLLRLTRAPDELRQALHHGPELESVRVQAQVAGHSCYLRSGASIFLYPQQYAAFRDVVHSLQFKPHFVVVNEAFLPMVLQAIRSIPSKANVRPRGTCFVALVDDEGHEVCAVERTFIRKISAADEHNVDTRVLSEP